MQFRLTIFLLAYWSLLINFGPSVHTHSFFGLCGCSDHVVTEVSGCCGHSCCASADNTDSSSTEDSLDAENPAGDCPLCEFFKYLNHSSAESVQWLPSESVAFIAFRNDQLLSTDAISSRARGPPELS